MMCMNRKKMIKLICENRLQKSIAEKWTALSEAHHEDDPTEICFCFRRCCCYYDQLAFSQLAKVK